MTRQESFKRRIRARMEKTGERYAAARRLLIEQTATRGRSWVSKPEMSDEAVTEGTGRGWDEWCELIEAWPGHSDGHAAIAKWLEAEHDIGGWWAQTVTVGYERITGIRLPYQMPDGTFTANKSKTITADAELLDKMLRHADSLVDLFPDQAADLRSKPDAKTIKIGMGGGVAVLSVAAKGERRCKVTVQHSGLATFDEVERWKFFWQEWLEALDDG